MVLFIVLFMVWNPTQTKVIGWGGVGWWVAHKILVSAPVPLELILTGFDWVGAGPWGFGDLGRGLTILVFGFNHYFQPSNLRAWGTFFYNKVPQFKRFSSYFGKSCTGFYVLKI